MGAELLVRSLTEGLGEPSPQVGEPTYASKITMEDRHLVWDRPAVELARVVRIGGAWTTFRGKRLIVGNEHFQIRSVTHRRDPAAGARRAR